MRPKLDGTADAAGRHHFVQIRASGSIYQLQLQHENRTTAKMQTTTIFLIVTGFALVLNSAYSSPINIPVEKVATAPAASNTIKATADDKLHDLKAHALNHLSSKAKMPNILDKGSKLEGAAAESTDSSTPDDTGDDTESKAGFW